jgi:hypothetical protein
MTLPVEITELNEKERDRLNHQAYMDVLDCKSPSMLDNEAYMFYYRGWRPLQKFPGEEEYWDNTLDQYWDDMLDQAHETMGQTLRRLGEQHYQNLIEADERSDNSC